MTPAKLQAMVDMDDYAHELAEANADKPARSRRPSPNPAQDLMALAAL